MVRGFTKPRDKHSFVGSPSVTVSAAVNKNRVIMWHVLKKTWNGASAAQMYKGPLLSAMRRTYGKSPTYTIVEDGDRKVIKAVRDSRRKRKLTSGLWFHHHARPL